MYCLLQNKLALRMLQILEWDVISKIMLLFIKDASRLITKHCA